METCQEMIDREHGRWPHYTLCGRKAVVRETHGKLPDTPYCTIHSTEAIERRHRRSHDRYEEQMAPKRYAWEAVAYCRALNLTLTDLQKINKSSPEK